ncbi:MAG: MFS transporter [Gammaproteobacteria bacterium]|nr:MAG: MFS transporter [Gammaproteobacteria bacterium]
MRSSKTSYSADPQVDRSLRHSIKDGIWFSIMTGGAESYFSAYAIHLSASTAIVGLLASLPPLLASFMQMVSAWLGRKLGRRKPIIVFGAFLQAACLFPLAFVPLFLPDYATLLLIPIVFVYLCGPNLGAPQWNSLIGDLVPDSRRGRFFAQRTRLSSVASITALIVAGLVLDATDRLGDAYAGFVAVFLLAAAARCVSAHHLQAIKDPASRVAALEVIEDLTLWRRFRHSSLLRFSMFYAAMQFAVAISGPYFTLYMLRDLALSYFEFMTITVASVLVQFLTLNRWGRLADMFGNRLLLITTGSIITVIPSLWLVSTHYAWLLAVQALSGLAWAGFTLSATAFVFDLTPSEHRATLFAVHNIFAALAVFLGASAGALLVLYVPEQISLAGTTIEIFTPLYGLFLLSCLTRITVALLFLPRLKEVRRVRPMSMSGLIFRVTRMHPISGLIYEVVGRARLNRPRDSADGD